MLLKNALYLDRNMEFVKGHIFIEGDKIEKIYKIKADLPNDMEIFDCSNYFVLPGLINSHTHNPATLARGLFRDMALKDWLNESYQGRLQEKLFNYLDENVESDEFRILCLKAYVEYIKQGITYIVETGQADNSYEATVKCLQEIGLKGTRDLDDAYVKYMDLESDCIKTCSHFPEEEDLTQEWIEFCQVLVEPHKPILMTHCLETNWRKDLVLKKFNCSTVQLLSKENLLNRRTVLFHCVQVDDADIKLIAEKEASIVYCPVSNMWSRAGEAPIHEFLSKGINVLLGTDFIQQDIWEVMRLTYYNLKLKSRDIDYSAQDIFKMVTQNPNNRVGKEMNTGIINEGYKADIIFIDKKNTRLLPIVNEKEFSNILHNLLLECREEMIRHVMIHGKWIMKDNQLTTVDEGALDKEYGLLSERLMNQWISHCKAH